MQNAASAASQDNFLGRSDWRLPTIAEMTSLLGSESACGKNIRKSQWAVDPRLMSMNGKLVWGEWDQDHFLATPPDGTVSGRYWYASFSTGKVSEDPGSERAVGAVRFVAGGTAQPISRASSPRDVGRKGVNTIDDRNSRNYRITCNDGTSDFFDGRMSGKECIKWCSSDYTGAYLCSCSISTVAANYCR